MKLIRTFVLILVAFALFFSLTKANAAEPKSFLANISVSPYAAIQHENITDGENYGAGIDIGVGINKFVSLHVLNTAYSTDHWGNSAIDETSVLAKFRLVRNASETLSLYGLGGGDRDWNSDDWAFGTGLGVELRITKAISLGVDSRIRAWFKGEKDLQTRGMVNISF